MIHSLSSALTSIFGFSFRKHFRTVSLFKFSPHPEEILMLKVKRSQVFTLLFLAEFGLKFGCETDT